MKQKQLLATVTVTVAALTTVGQKARSGTIMATNTAKRREEVFIARSGCKGRCLIEL
jgi:hypothetical protein